MPDLTAKRTLVKSPPELWSELSEVERLARHLGAFGEIKITKLEPEHTVAWEGEGASGTVSIEPSGWGTKVTLTAQLEGAVVDEPVVEDVTLEASPPPETAAEEEVEVEAIEEPVGEEPVAEEPVAEAPPVVEPPPPEPVEPIGAKPRRKRGFLAWLFRQRTSTQVAAPPVPAPAGAVGEAPVVAEPPVAEEPPMAEKPPMAEEPPMVEEPPLAEEPVEVEEPAVLPVPAAADEPLQLDASPAEEAAADEDRLDRERAQAILDGALDALGSAHHRPFSRG